MSGETVVASSRGSPRTCSSVKRWNRLEELLGAATPRRGGAFPRGTPGRRRRTGPPPCARRPRARLSAKTMQRPLPAELARERHDVARRRGADVNGCLGRAGERDAAHAGMPRQRCPDLLPDPLHDVEDARREARLVHEIAEERARQRRPLGRLEDHGAARRERGCCFPRRQHERRVPRRDHDRRRRSASATTRFRVPFDSQMRSW